MALISKKKILYRINHQLRRYLKKYNREYTMNISYADLLRYDNAIVLYDKIIYPITKILDRLILRKVIGKNLFLFAVNN